MKITFIKDCPPIIASGNSAYKAGVQADLRRGQELIDSGYAREGWEFVKAPTPTPTLDNLSYRELQRMAKTAGVPANQSKDELVEALTHDD